MEKRTIKNIDWEIIRNRIIGEINEKEEELFQEWISASKDHKIFYDRAVSYLKNEKNLEEFEKNDYKKAFDDFLDRISKRKRRLIVRYLLKYAAFFIFFIISGWYTLNYLLPEKFEKYSEANVKTKLIIPGSNKAELILADGCIIDLSQDIDIEKLQQKNIKIENLKGEIIYGRENEIVEIHTLKIPKGGEYNLKLSDGTSVWLNADSKLKYPNAFSGKTREVFLEGEAYFEVVENKKKLFIVHVNNLSVNVTGTSFNIKAYNNEKNIETTLITGGVKIKNTETNKETTLTPGYQSVYNKIEKKNSVEPADINSVIAWKDGYFVFNNKTLDDILKDISRWYDIDFKYEDDSLKGLHFTGKLKKYENLNSFTDMLELTGKVKFKIDENKLIVCK